MRTDKFSEVSENKIQHAKINGTSRSSVDMCKNVSNTPISKSSSGEEPCIHSME